MSNIPQKSDSWHHPLPKPIERLLTETARTVQRNEIRWTLWALVTGTVMFFILIVLVEHWIFPRGLSAHFRFLLLALLLGTWTTLFYRNILPFYHWKLHPYYLAHLIETAHPDLKNNLLNLLYILRKSETDADVDSVIDNSIPENSASTSSMERRVIRLLERQTAKQAATLEVSVLFPTDPARRWKIVAVALLVLFLTYAIFAPKSTFRTVARTLLPWCEIDAPTRVRIVAITTSPTNLRIHQGETFTVTAEIHRLPRHAQPTLFYTSADRKHVRVPIPMTRITNEKTPIWQAKLHTSATDSIRSLTWRLEAGDAVSNEFPLQILSPLRAVMDSVTLTPPQYTQLPIIHQKTGDILAVSGTHARFFVHTSEPTDKVTLKIESKNGSKPKTLTLSPQKNNARTTKFQGEYLLKCAPQLAKDGVHERLTATLHFQNADGETSRAPLRYQWEIRPDLAPQIRLLDAPAPDVAYSSNAKIPALLEVADPDFGLRAVAFCASWNGKLLHIPPLLSLSRTEPSLKTPWQTEFIFTPTDWGLESGDEILWWIEAADSRAPTPNRSRTEPRRLRIHDAVNAEPENGENTENQDENRNASNKEDSENTDDTQFPVSAEIPDAPSESDAQDEENAKNSENGDSGETSPNGENNESSENGDSEENSDQSGNESSENSGENGDQSGKNASENERERGTKPKLAPEGYDPLTEEKTEENSNKNGNQNGKNGESEGNSESEETSEKEEGENGAEPEKQTGEKSGKKPSEQPDDSAESDKKTNDNAQGKQPKFGEPSLQEQMNDDGDSDDENDEPPTENSKKKTGKSSENGAKTDSELPEDTTNAQSGLQDGADSDQDLPAPVAEKEKTDGSDLRDSNNTRPDRETLQEDETDGDSDGDSDEITSENTRLANEREQEEGSQPDPVHNPGEAIEEILKHRQKQLPTANQNLNENESEADDNSENPVNEVPSEALNGPRAQEEQQKGRSSNKNGNQLGNDGDQKSNTQIPPDNSVESAGNKDENRGGNHSGADEQSNQQGLGRDGGNTPNASGSPTGSGGEGPTNKHGGTNALADHPTGNADPEQRAGNNSSAQSGSRESQAHGSGQETQRTERSTASGGSGIDENVRTPTGDQSDIRPSAKEDAVNVEFARQQTVLALKHLRNALDRNDESLLEYLGWTREEARQFLKEWEKLNQNFARNTLTEAERRRMEDTFRNLGLTPRTLHYKNKTATESHRPNARGGRKIAPPSKWQEQFDAYSRGTGNGF